MRLSPIAALFVFLTTLPAFAAPSEEEVAAARIAYINGDYDAALSVIREAADAGNATALNILGAAYDDGRGVEKDSAQAVVYFEKAAKAGEVRALYNLGTVCLWLRRCSRRSQTRQT